MPNVETITKSEGKTMATDTYSERLLEDYPQLTRTSVIKLLGQHGFRPDSPTMARATDSATFDNELLPWGDPDSTFDAEFGTRETYSTPHVMAWLGY